MMRLHRRLTHQLFHLFANHVAFARDPNVVIGGQASPYLLRWHVIPRNPLFNIYLHRFMRSDDDRALHDHPWFNLSLVLAGAYREHTIRAGGIHQRRLRRAGDLVFRTPWTAHRVELLPSTARLVPRAPAPCWTLFITGPRIRTWGFHCEVAGWIPWQKFTAPGKPGEVGKGCEQ